MKTKICSLLFAFALVGNFVMAESAYAFNTTPVGCEQVQTLSVVPGVSTHADEIVYQTRIYDGRLQYRRWNKTQACWVDPDWIDGWPTGPAS